MIGVLNAKRECWVLTCLISCNDLGINLLTDERRFFGFDPIEKAMHLTQNTTDQRYEERKESAN
jgi:hypothetical protein